MRTLSLCGQKTTRVIAVAAFPASCTEDVQRFTHMRALKIAMNLRLRHTGITIICGGAMPSAYIPCSSNKGNATKLSSKYHFTLQCTSRIPIMVADFAAFVMEAHEEENILAVHVPLIEVETTRRGMPFRLLCGDLETMYGGRYSNLALSALRFTQDAPVTEAVVLHPVSDDSEETIAMSLMEHNPLLLLSHIAQPSLKRIAESGLYAYREKMLWWNFNSNVVVLLRGGATLTGEAIITPKLSASRLPAMALTMEPSLAPWNWGSARGPSIAKNIFELLAKTHKILITQPRRQPAMLLPSAIGYAPFHVLEEEWKQLFIKWPYQGVNESLKLSGLGRELVQFALCA